MEVKRKLKIPVKEKEFINRNISLNSIELETAGWWHLADKVSPVTSICIKCYKNLIQ
jgi:hypothetical protein